MERRRPRRRHSGFARLCLLARCPVAGKVKTRLFPRLGPAAAARLQRAMTEDLLARFARTPASWDLEVRLTGDCAASLRVPDRWRVLRQGPGGLGDRLLRGLEAAGAAGAGRLLFVGADAPLLPRALLAAAISTLAHRDVVVAPAEDGGYVLIGLALDRAAVTRFRRLFRDVRWGGDRVLAATLEAAAAAGLRLAELPLHWDVDRPEDLARLTRALAAPGEAARAPRTARVVAREGPPSGPAPLT